MEPQWVAVQEKTFTKWSVGTYKTLESTMTDACLAVKAECQSQRSRCSCQESGHRPLRWGELNPQCQCSASKVRRLCGLTCICHRSSSSTFSKSSATSPSAGMPRNPNSVFSASKMSMSPSTLSKHEAYR